MGGRVHFLPPGGMSQCTPHYSVVSRGDYHAPSPGAAGSPAHSMFPFQSHTMPAVGARLGEAVWVQREGLRPPPISGARDGAL